VLALVLYYHVKGLAEENSRHFVIQSEVKPEPIASRLHTSAASICFEFLIGSLDCLPLL